MNDRRRAGFSDQYIRALKCDAKAFLKQQQGFFSRKSSQQSMLERLLAKKRPRLGEVGDIACGSGALSYFLSKSYPSARFTLVDLNRAVLAQAMKALGRSEQFAFLPGDLYNLEAIPDGRFDLTCCWQTLSWVEHPRKALDELLRVTRAGGLLYLSALFNLDFDVDFYTKAYDHTRPTSGTDLYFRYNTLSAKTVSGWLKGRCRRHVFHRHEIEIDLPPKGRGLGTSTLRLADGRRLQVSGGMLMNWAILEAEI